MMVTALGSAGADWKADVVPGAGRAVSVSTIRQTDKSPMQRILFLPSACPNTAFTFTSTS
jgi:hypothetical protein